MKLKRCLMAVLWPSVQRFAIRSSRFALAACITTMCLETQAQAPASGVAAPGSLGKDTTVVRDTIAIEEVLINTGYQHIPKERVTGSFIFIDSALLNRSFSTDVLSRLEGVVSGLRFNRSPSLSQDDVNLTLRGPSTLQAENQPLIILDNFEYQGELRNINPNDIANITVLRDAAASSIWGAKAGNGVIVITTKTGRYDQPTRVSFTSNVSFQGPEDLYRMPTISGASYIDLEKELFSKGHYDYLLSHRDKPVVSPLVWLLDQQRKGIVNEAEADAAIALFREHDLRNDVSRYLRQPAVRQQHAISFNGGGESSQYYASVGWDNNRSQMVGNAYRRLTLTFNNTFGLLQNKLEIRTGLFYTKSNTLENGITNVPGLTYPYGRLTDNADSHLAIAQYNPGFIDTVGRGRLLDWHYRPLDELGLADNTDKLVDIKANADIGYRPTEWLRLKVLYQYANGVTDGRNYHNAETYFVRDLINQFSSIAANGEVIRPVPLGGILDQNTGAYTAHRVRGQADLTHTWGYSEVQALLGGELNSSNTLRHSTRYYGYDEQMPNTIPIDPTSPYRSMVSGRNIRINDGKSLSHLVDRFISFYGNVGYGYRKKYWFTASIRKDGSNLFGVRTNQQWNPLWSVGAKWIASQEDFFEADWLPELTFRLTYGTSGNIDRSVTAYLVASSSLTNLFNRPTMVLQSPPNPNLTWETVATTNIGLDFSFFSNNRLSGSIDYFYKQAYDLISPAELSAVTGQLTYAGNTASIRGQGIDLSLSTRNLNGRFSWQTTLLFSVVRDKVSEYRVTPANNSSYVGGSLMVGKPLGAIYAYRWAGLSPENGNPLGYLGGSISDDYSTMVSNTDQQDIRYMGPSSAPLFGSVMNTFSYDNWNLSFNILYKGGYYYRNGLLNYGNLFNNGVYRLGAAEYEHRWQRPGDEAHTHVPSMIYPQSPTRDQFYGASEMAIERGDFIRLQDIRLSYDWKRLNAFIIASNSGLLYKASNLDYDPERGFTNRAVTFSCGFKLNF